VPTTVPCIQIPPARASSHGAPPTPVPSPYPNTGAQDAASGLPATQVASCASTKLEPVKVGSDPEEGGQVSAAGGAAKSKISDFHITHKIDKSSPMLAQDARSGSATCPQH
jgi:hypothetical protein